MRNTNAESKVGQGANRVLSSLVEPFAVCAHPIGGLMSSPRTPSQ